MSAVDRLAVALGALGDRVRRDEAIGPLTTYRVGGPAALLVEVDDPGELHTLAAALVDDPVPVLVVGRGSNLLVADGGFDGVVVRLGESFGWVDVTSSRVVAGGGAALPVVARRSAAAGWRGFEWAVGVPGSMGGAVRMNAGGHGSDMAATLAWVRVLDLRSGDDVEVPAVDLGLGYRTSNLGPQQVVLSVAVDLVAGDAAEAEAELSEIVGWRREHQPGGANAGSVFTNPPGDSAGRLIDEAGAKGLRVGTAEVSTKHANFIQADPGGSADDIVALMAQVQRRVHDRFGVHLEPETRLVGFADGLLS